MGKLRRGDELAAAAKTNEEGRRDLLERIHAAETQPHQQPGSGPTVTRVPLQADQLAARQRYIRMALRNQQLEVRFSELLGEQAWYATGLGAPTDSDELQQRIVALGQQTVELWLQLGEGGQDLAANRELMARLNAARSTGRHSPKRLYNTCCTA